jgi:hypothetical protein
VDERIDSLSSARSESTRNVEAEVWSLGMAYRDCRVSEGAKTDLWSDILDGKSSSTCSDDKIEVALTI